MNELDNISMMFDRKGYGRIFVEHEEDIEKVKEIIKSLDEEEFEYLPKDLITTFSPDTFNSTYVHKFCDLDMGKVLKEAWAKGIHCFVVFGDW